MASPHSHCNDWDQIDHQLNDPVNHFDTRGTRSTIGVTDFIVLPGTADIQEGKTKESTISRGRNHRTGSEAS